jgi:hypothetical protein
MGLCVYPGTPVTQRAGAGNGMDSVLKIRNLLWKFAVLYVKLSDLGSIHPELRLPGFSGVLLEG